jgi:MFS family permease
MDSNIKLIPLFLTESFRNTAVSLLNFFNCIFIYKVLLDVTTNQKSALAGAVMFFFGLNVATFFANFIADYLSLYWGLKKTMILGQIIFIISLFYLLTAKAAPSFLVLASILFGIASAFYWFGWHSLMAKEGCVGKFGREIGLNGIIGTAFSLATPLLGGITITLLGYQGMFIAAIVMVIISLVFLSHVKEEGLHHRTTIREVLSLFQAHPKAFLAYFGISAASGSIETIILPLYLFLILKRELSLGEFFTFSMVVSAFIGLAVGRLVDLKGGKRLLELGSGVHLLVWISRTLVKFPLVLLFVDVVSRMTASMVSIPLSVEGYEKAILDHNTGRSTLFRESALTLGSITVFLLIALLVICGLPIESAFVIAAVCSLFPLLSDQKPTSPPIQNIKH